VSVYLLGRRVATLPGGEEPDVQRRVQAADALIRSLFDDARTCKEARQLADGRDSLLELKQRLLSASDSHATPAAIAIVYVESCPRCRELRTPAPPPSALHAPHR